VTDAQDATPPDDEREERRRGAGWFVAVPAITFVLGALLGGLVIGVGRDSPEAPGAGEATPGSGPTSSGPSTAVVVPDSCLEAAETVRRATEVLREGVGAIRDFKVQPILDLLDDLEDLDGEARAQASTCTGTRVTDAGDPTESPSGDASSTPSATPSSTPSETPGG